VQMLAGCLSVLKREECSLVGGHTSEGAECSMGLAVSGIAHPDRVFHKGLSGGYFAIKAQCNSSANSSSSSSSASKIILSADTDDAVSNGHLGHVLVLTKALGTGTIMAAHMRAKVTTLTLSDCTLEPNWNSFLV
jgi:selenophosphate synthase